MQRELYDVVLIVLMVTLMVFKAVLLDKSTRLGKSMATYNIVLAVTFSLSLILGPRAVEQPDILWLFVALRVGIIASVLWSIIELTRATWISDRFR